MPPIQSISCNKNSLEVKSEKGSFKFDVSQIPQDKDSIQKLEDYLNNVWLPHLIGNDYQLKVHVFSLSPLVLTSWCADIGVKMQQDWWLD